MSAAAFTGPAGTLRWPMGAKIADWTIGLVIFLGGFVIVEPAPYDLFLVAVVIVWAFFGLKFNRHVLPMTTLMLLYLAGGFLSFTQIDTFDKPFVYMATTVFLVASSIFFAAVILEAPDRRFGIIEKAYLASAVASAIFGIVAYFELFPGAEFFKHSQRAAGAFQDANVFGPFLVLAAALFSRRILTAGLAGSTWALMWFGVVCVAIFLSFSRAAWMLLAFSVLSTSTFAYITQYRTGARLRIIASFVTLIVVLTGLLAAVSTLPTVSGLFEQRAQLLQDYDTGRSGRFDRQASAVGEIMEKPLGLGPTIFARKYGQEVHNMWLKAFVAYGWIGGIAYAVLAIWTLIAGFPLLFRTRPWQPFIQATYAVFVGHLMMHLVIDVDHWRHMFMIYGLLWGAIAADRVAGSRQARQSILPA